MTRLTEQKLRNIISESISKVLSESSYGLALRGINGAMAKQRYGQAQNMGRMLDTNVRTDFTGNPKEKKPGIIDIEDADSTSITYFVTINNSIKIHFEGYVSINNKEIGNLEELITKNNNMIPNYLRPLKRVTAKALAQWCGSFVKFDDPEIKAIVSDPHSWVK